MASIALSEVPLLALKQHSLAAFKHVKSSHLTEALSRALGYATHAALRADLPAQAADPAIVLLDEHKFAGRLEELGYTCPSDFSFESFVEIRYGRHRKTGKMKRINVERPDAYKVGLISTTCFNQEPHQYKSTRARAWRNLMVSGVNESLRRKAFSLRPGDNRWASADSSGRTTRDHEFEFELLEGVRARCSVRDVGFDELCVEVHLLSGEANGHVFVERSRGAWLQSGESSYHGTRAITPRLADMDVNPMGYGDKGAIIM
ncbi:hypothetical protein [Burkholderia diffusa]|uniref:hypothetical protein n=1 Tax=Burkholderia diffusa TaxID=488732 RepID=UPI00158F0FAE|nr:hypothetical protein [Burkholderia diffusa]